MVSVRRLIVASVFLAFLLPLAGCKDEVQEAWRTGYQANYKAGYQAGLETGKPRGKEEGEKRGAAEAREAAETGCAWQLYSTLACVALIFGILVGLFAQYLILLTCRLSGRLPQLSTVAFVPAMKSSLSYSIFEQRRRLMIEVNQELTKLRVTHNMQLAQLQTARDFVVRQGYGRLKHR